MQAELCVNLFVLPFSLSKKKTDFEISVIRLLLRRKDAKRSLHFLCMCKKLNCQFLTICVLYTLLLVICKQKVKLA